MTLRLVNVIIHVNFVFFCTVHCNIQYKPTNCTFPKLILVFLIFYVFYMFRTPGFIFRKTVVYTVMVRYALHASV